MELKIKHTDRQANFSFAQLAGKKLLQKIVGPDPAAKLISHCQKVFRDSLVNSYVDCLSVSIDPERGEITAWSKYIPVDKSTISKLIKDIRNWQQGKAARRPNPNLMTWMSVLIGTRGIPPMAKEAVTLAVQESSRFVANYLDRPFEIKLSEIAALAEFTAIENSAPDKVNHGTVSITRSTVEMINQINSESLGTVTEPLTIQSVESLIYAKFESWLLTIAGIPNGRWFE